MEEKEEPKFNFEGQRDDEEIVAIWRQHPWVMAKIGFIVVVILFVACIPLIWLGWSTFAIYFIVAGCLISAVLISMVLYSWWNTFYILSNQRILGFDQGSPLARKVYEVPLENIQNITHIQKGMGAMTFGYGTVQIRTAGGKTAMRIKNVEHPLEAQQKITDTGRGLSRPK